MQTVFLRLKYGIYLFYIRPSAASVSYVMALCFPLPGQVLLKEFARNLTLDVPSVPNIEIHKWREKHYWSSLHIVVHTWVVGLLPWFGVFRL